MKNGKDSGSALVVGLVALGGLLAVLLAAGAVLFFYVDGVRNEGIAREKQLNAQYSDNQNELSNLISNFHEQIGIANLKSEKFDQILSDAVKGRYEGENGKMGYGQGTPFFSAIMEAYPDLKGLDIYDRVGSLVASLREAYKNKQTKLLDQLRGYDVWREKGLVRSRVVGWLGFPSQGLEARIGTKVLRGTEAREQMYLIVLTKSTREAYETGTMDPLQVTK